MSGREFDQQMSDYVNSLDDDGKRRWIDFLFTPFWNGWGEYIDPLVEIGAQPPGWRDRSPSVGLFQVLPATRIVSEEQQ